jgi:hypothetical protein
MDLRSPNPKTQNPIKFQALNLKRAKTDESFVTRVCVAVDKANSYWRGIFNVFATGAIRGLSVFR